MQPDKVDYPLTYEAYRQNQKRRLQMRKTNIQEHEDDFLGGTRKTSQIKIIQKFISKLKADNKNYQAILSQLQVLNMAKYIEQVSNIVANSVNQKQITFYVQIATKLNTSYENVAGIMIKDLVRVFNASLESQEDTKQKLKSIFLFVVELFICGFSFSYKEVIEMLKKIFKSGKNKKSNHSSQTQGKLFIYWYSTYTFTTFLTNFADIFTKRTPKWFEIWQQQQKRQLNKYPEVMPIKMKQQLTHFFSKYANQCYNLLKEVVEKIKQYQTELHQFLKLQGQFNKQVQKNYNQIIDKYLITRSNLKIIALSINQPLDFEPLDIKITPTQQIIAKYINKVDNAQIYQDQFQKQIYEKIPQDLIQDNQQKNSPIQQSYKQFKSKLDNCKNVADSNQITKQFSKVNTKKNRKLLAKDVLEYRKQYHLVTPYLCRIVGIVNKKYKDIGEYINQLVFNQYQKLKDNANNTFVVNDKKARYYKYICQFTKYGVIEPQKTMNCIEYLIDNLNGYNIQLIVAVLQNVGRYLHLSEISANKFTFLMNKYQNVIKKKSLPIFTTSQLTNSINLLKPRKQSKKYQQKKYTKQQLLAQQILSKCIFNDIDIIIEQLSLLLKTKQGLQATQQMIMKKIDNFDFLNSYNYAYLLQQLQNQQLSKYIVERSIQMLYVCLLKGQNQKSILWAKYIAELYKYKLLERALLFSVIYNMMKITTNQTGVINAICKIFQACIGYINSKKTSKQNQKFMLFVNFLRFISKCAYIPMLEQFQIIETVDAYYPEISELTIGSIEEFVRLCDQKMKNQNKEQDYTLELDKYLQRKNIKKKKQQPIKIAVDNNDEKQYRPKVEVEVQEEDQEESQKRKNQQDNSMLMQQNKLFEKQLVDIMEATRKQYSSRIAKPIYLQKNIEKRKEKKKSGPCITIIGRSGNKFIRKDIPKKDTTTPPNGNQ